MNFITSYGPGLMLIVYIHERSVTPDGNGRDAVGLCASYSGTTRSGGWGQV